MSTPKAAKATDTKENPPPVDPVDKPKAAAVGDGPFQLVNPGTTSMVYDMEGHSLGPGRRLTLSTLDRVAWQAVRNAYLLCQDAAGNWVTFDRKGVCTPRPLSAAQRRAASGNAPSTDNAPPAGGASQPEST